MKKYILFLFVIMALSCSSKKTRTSIDKTNKDDSQKPFSLPKNEIDSPVLLAVGTISTGLYERDFAINPNKDEIFFSINIQRINFGTIVCMKKNNGKWSNPEVASFSGKYSDLEPAFSPDGKKLFFASTRPVDSTDSSKDFDIWYVEIQKNGQWSSPRHTGDSVNSAGNEFYPSVAQNGNLYITASLPDSKGKEDIYLCKYINGQYSKPVSLDTTINSNLFEFNAYIAPDESYIIFSSFGRQDGYGGGDLYISKKQSNGEWTKAQNMGEKINSEKLDYCPFVDFEQKFLYFTSEKTHINNPASEKMTYKKLTEILQQPKNGQGDIYVVSMEKYK